MRKVLIELLGGMVFAATTAIAGCNSATNPAESAAGGSSSTGGAVGTGGSPTSAGASPGTGGVVGVGGGPTSSGGNSTGSGGTSGGDSVTTLGNSKVLNTLTAAEVAQLCTDSYEYFERSISRATVCKWKGVYFATQSSAPTEAILRSNCTSKETPCLSATDSPWTSQSCSDFPADCTKTVADYSTCIKDQAAWLVEKVAGLPACATFTSEFWTPVWDIVGATQPASCEFCSTYYAPDPRQF